MIVVFISAGLSPQTGRWEQKCPPSSHVTSLTSLNWCDNNIKSITGLIKDISLRAPPPPTQLNLPVLRGSHPILCMNINMVLMCWCQATWIISCVRKWSRDAGACCERLTAAHLSLNTNKSVLQRLIILHCRRNFVWTMPLTKYFISVFITIILTSEHWLIKVSPLVFKSP